MTALLHRLRTLPLAAALIAAAALPARAQARPDAAQVVREMAERAERELRGVRGYTVAETVSGSPATLHFIRRDGGAGWAVRPALGRGEAASPAVALAVRDLAQWQANLPALLREHADRFRYLRADTLRGRPVHVVATDDGALALGGAPTGSARPTRATFWVDADARVPLRVELRGEVVDAAGRREPSASTLDFSDYRATPGAPTLPFRTVLVMEQSSMVPPRAMAEEMRAGLDRIRARPGLAPAERARYDALARMVDAAIERGALELEVDVRQVLPENGPPA
jgi:hypothetical protein